MQNSTTTSAWLALRLTFGVIPIAAGADKFFDLLTHWEQYVSPLAARLLPFSPAVFMRAVGIIEIAVGILVLTRWTRIGAYLASAWLLVIALNLISTGHFLDVAARDVALAVSAFALARLEEARLAERSASPVVVGHPLAAT
jgi:uncharacterized membrane protein YphA (DoxX/SURF4 family)